MKIIIKIGLIICALILNIIFINPEQFGDNNNLRVESFIRLAKSNEEIPGFEYWEKTAICMVKYGYYIDWIKCCTVTFEYCNCTPEPNCLFPWEYKDCSEF